MKTPLHSFLLLTGLLISAFTCTNPAEPDNKPTGSDTTSHNFFWQSFRLGKSNSIARDVHVFSDTNVWVVGGFSTKDHYDDNGNNLAIWNGVEWKFKQFRLWKDYRALGGELKQELTSITGILAFSENDIVLMDGYSSIARWNGTQWSYEQPAYQFDTYDGTFQIAGVSTHDFYMFGYYRSNGGLNIIIIHYKNGVFTSVANSLHAAVYDATTDETGTVWFSTYDHGSVEKYNTLYKLTGNSITQFYNFNTDQDTVVRGAFALDYKNKTLFGIGVNCWKWKPQATFNPTLFSVAANPQGTWAMSVNSENDVIFGSSGFAISHWNGSTLKSYPELYIDMYGEWVTGAGFNQNTAVVCGYIDDYPENSTLSEPYAYVIIGKQIP